MKYLHTILAAACLSLAAACSDDDPVVTINTDQPSETIAYEGREIEVPFTTAAAWTASTDAKWCRLYRTQGEGDASLVVDVQANLGEARTATLTITAEGEQHTVTINQAAKPAGEELVYKLPVVFHVLYFNPDDPVQNVPTATINAMLEKVNKFYRGLDGRTTDLGLEFVPATRDPRGNLLAEPGINRVQWVNSSLNAEDVMSDQTRKYVHLQWDPNDYVNILLYPFTDSSILGISTFPLAPKTARLDGLDAVEDYDYTYDNLCEVRGLSINSIYIADPSDYLSDVAPAEWKQLIDLQNEGYITLAHELGHYVGLRHTFSENWYCSDTDFCTDTPSYDRGEYSDYVLGIYDELDADPSTVADIDWEELFCRRNCQKEHFESHNIMDYAYSYLDEFTPEQRARVRHVLTYSPFIPGPKLKAAPEEEQPATRTLTGPVKLPLSIADAEPRINVPRKK